MILLYINIKAERKQAENGLIYLHEIQKHWKPSELYSNRVSLWKGGGIVILFLCILAFSFLQILNWQQ